MKPSVRANVERQHKDECIVCRFQGKKGNATFIIGGFKNGVTACPNHALEVRNNFYFWRLQKR